MARISVDLFGEDAAHEAFLRALIDRLARQEKVAANLRVVRAKGGRGVVLSEFKLYQRARLRGPTPRPDLAVIAIDANCENWNEARSKIAQTVEPGFESISVIACPDPHIGRWFMTDPSSFKRMIGIEPPLESAKCERDRYKRMLSASIAKAGHLVLQGAREFAQELVDAMDLYRAGKREPSLGSFIQDAAARFRQFKRA
jgi:hypothetical protein